MTQPADPVSAVAEVFRLLGDPTRLRIALACLDGERNVGEIEAAVGQSQSLVSHHLRLLRTARIMRATRQGRSVAYAIDDDHVRFVLRNMIAHFTEPHEHPPDAEADGQPETEEIPCRASMSSW